MVAPKKVRVVDNIVTIRVPHELTHRRDDRVGVSDAAGAQVQRFRSGPLASKLSGDTSGTSADSPGGSHGWAIGLARADVSQQVLSIVNGCSGQGRCLRQVDRE